MCTRFFHHMTNSHFRKNALVRVKIEGVWLSNDQEVREGISRAFQSLLLDKLTSRAEIEGLPLATLCPKEARSMEVPFREEKVYVALNELNGDKPPGPDGFSIFFRQESWNLVKGDLMDLFKEFYDRESFTKSLNTTFIV